MMTVHVLQLAHVDTLDICMRHGKTASICSGAWRSACNVSHTITLILTLSRYAASNTDAWQCVWLPAQHAGGVSSDKPSMLRFYAWLCSCDQVCGRIADAWRCLWLPAQRAGGMNGDKPSMLHWYQGFCAGL